LVRLGPSNRGKLASAHMSGLTFGNWTEREDLNELGGLIIERQQGDLIRVPIEGCNVALYPVQEANLVPDGVVVP